MAKNVVGPPRVLTVDTTRLLGSLASFSALGKTSGQGLSRLSLNDHDKDARDLLARLALESGYVLQIDAIGNMFITRTGTEPSLPRVLIGSHLDSQPLGGRYDGTYGVLSGLEVLKSLDDAGIATERDITLVNWTNEEGARFAPSLMGSSVFVGALPLRQALKQRDAQGISVEEELDRIGYAGTFNPTSFKIHRSLELHIEQGPILEKTGIDIGVVTGTQALRWYDIQIEGSARHAGTTPHRDRKDALAAAAHLITEVGKIADVAGEHFRGTVGELRISPNSRNVIPGHALLRIDFRHPDDGVLDRAEQALTKATSSTATTFDTPTTIKTVLQVNAKQFATNVKTEIATAAQALGLSHLDLVSGANHDSANLTEHTDAGMIFIPCVGGISHTEAEDIREQWAINGANVLLVATLASANQVKGHYAPGN